MRSVAEISTIPSSMNLSRRAALSGLAVLAVPTSAAAVCVAPGFEGPDPIFEVIERHRAAFMARLIASAVYSETPTFGPDYDEATCEASMAADSEGVARDREAALALTTTRPTTREGVTALLAYVDAFNNRAIKLPHMPDDWYSCPFMWPCVPWEDVDAFAHLVVGNAAAALRDLEARS